MERERPESHGWDFDLYVLTALLPTFSSFLVRIPEPCRWLSLHMPGTNYKLSEEPCTHPFCALPFCVLTPCLVFLEFALAFRPDDLLSVPTALPLFAGTVGNVPLTCAFFPVFTVLQGLDVKGPCPKGTAHKPCSVLQGGVRGKPGCEGDNDGYLLGKEHRVSRLTGQCFLATSPNERG